MVTNRKILVLDDEQDIVNLYKEFFTDHAHYNADCFISSDEAWKSLEKQPYDLLILDHIMPVISGREFAEKIKGECELNGKTPILFITAIPKLLEEIKNSYESIDVLAKPIKFNEINNKIESLLLGD